jgi:hypothetical protein
MDTAKYEKVYGEIKKVLKDNELSSHDAVGLLDTIKNAVLSCNL